MTSIDGIDELHMSGARAVFTVKNGAEVDEEQIAQAFEDEGMALEIFEEVERPRARALYTVDAGIT